jgi:acyl-lipid omega-6 desaturase (Delta-12 desaturase)
MLAPYECPDTARATRELVLNLVLLGAAFTAANLALGISIWLALAISVIMAGLLVRTFIVMHDCAHGSFFPDRRANEIVGFITGVITLTPFARWRRDHAMHHASAGDLERRGHGDVPTLTLAEYRARGFWGRLRYRVFRMAPVLLLLGTLHMMVMQRLPTGDKRTTGSVWWTNLGILVLAFALAAIVGWKALALTFLPAYLLAAATGTWLFYVQHQFEDTYWEQHAEWDYVDAALRGSSYLRLPKLLQWFTGNIGFHHVHHLGPRIPNYNLQRCHEENSLFHEVSVVTLKGALASARLALWDEDRQRLISFREARVPLADPAPPRLSAVG